MTIFKHTYMTNEQHSAKVLGSGSLNVLATPALVAFMENASCLAIAHLLPKEQTTVGTAIDVQHLAASKIGDKVTVFVKHYQVKGRHFEFDIEAYVEEKLIGKSKHQRVAIDAQQFLNHLNH
ncbi:thioesterase family protein [Streptococcus dentasini]